MGLGASNGSRFSTFGARMGKNTQLGKITQLVWYELGVYTQCRDTVEIDDIEGGS